MSYRHTLEAAVESLQEIEDLVRGFPENGKIPAVEIDLALQKLRNLYELLLLVKGIENAAPPEKVEEKAEAPDEKPDTDTTEKQTSSAVFVVEESKKTTVAVSSTLEEKKSAGNDVANEEISRIKTTKTTKSAVIQTLADQFKGRPTLLETLGQSYNRDDETLAHSKPITDLMSAIALNDRFTFIRELFKNDKKDFENAMDALNNAGSFNSAYNLMMQQYDWDMNDEAVQLLLSVVRRKYSKG